VSDLRNKIIRLAYAKPELRTHLLPLVASEKVTIVLDFDEIKKTGSIVAKFLSPIKLYRVIDGEELMNILKKGSIKGGEYSADIERAYGSQWGANKEEVIKWGIWQQGQRLGHELFLLEIDGNGKTFFNMNSPNKDSAIQKAVEEESTEPFSIDASLCGTGLGCSVQVETSEVVKWYQIENGTSVEKTLSAIKEIAKSNTLGLKPRKIILYGAVPAKLNPDYLKPLVYHWGDSSDHKKWGLEWNYQPDEIDWEKQLRTRTYWNKAQWSQNKPFGKQKKYSFMEKEIYFLVAIRVETTVKDFKVDTLPPNSEAKVLWIQIEKANGEKEELSQFAWRAKLLTSSRSRIKFRPQ